MNDKIAVAGTDGKKLQLKLMALDEAVAMLNSYRHFDYTEEQKEKLRKAIVSPKGYFVEFNGIKFRLLKVS